MKKRIEYLDAMRGFTMFLVVYNHFERIHKYSIMDILIKMYVLY